MFETGVVRADEYSSWRHVRRHNRDIFLIFFDMKVCCVFLLVSPHRGDSNEYAQYTLLNIFCICSYCFFSRGFKNESETAVLNEQLVFELIKIYCILF